MTTKNNSTTTFHQLCSSYLEDYFAKNPLTKAFELEDFTAPEDGLLTSILKPGTGIPKNPFVKKKTKPSLLLHGLQNTNCKNSEVYKFIDDTKDVCSGLYGTSGAGKTRSIYEYLSHSFGLYFVANTTYDPGSKDLSMLIEAYDGHRTKNHFLSEIGYSSSFDDEDSSTDVVAARKQKLKVVRSQNNYKELDRHIQVMISVRSLVFMAVKTELEKE
ncbi:expressed unknown protein [Seminavis robusta]|uniref:Uncharacterized protein n=1 Tax=Seminavis robusta TaxID=568900 RepID=A0A9N8H7X6_9STRA|nr:expressed unknown protein [Seminavis robusta]|eukprot:Sro142_g066220.1 n/a (216) ;mRNA; r:45492-46139